MPRTKINLCAIPNEQWGAILRAPITNTECAFLGNSEADQDQIVVIYNAKNAPPVVTIDTNTNQSLITVKADGAPLAVMSCQTDQIPTVADILLVARHIAYNA